MSILEIAKQFENYTSNGFQLTKRKGILTTTWAIYKTGEYFYYFDISEPFVLDMIHRYTYEELINEFKDGYYEINDVIGL